MALEPVAIIGIGCRYPGVDNPDAFWKLLQNGVDAVSTVPQARKALIQSSKITVTGQTATQPGGFLEQIDQFDPQFFGIAPREVYTMDPQQRLMLEVAWEAMEDAGLVPEQLRGSRTGVFVGIGTHDYSILLWQEPVDDPYATTGTGNCIAANRISYLFDFKGPSLAIDTACSSSLVAVHLACQSLWSGESSMALAGGVNVLLLPNVTHGFAKGGFMSPQGRCRSFDAGADGYVRSEGAGMVVLKPLSQALADGDSIYAVIRGTAVNQDGFSQGLAAPNGAAQEEVLRAAYRRAGISPGQVQYVEAHGTGTKLGDPIELGALGRVLAEGRPTGSVCAIGSVKTNIGHTETAAGIAGLIKTALCLKHKQIPPSLHFQTPNPQIDFEHLPLRVQDCLVPWPASPALAGVNSFGFGGTNAHVVLQEAPSTTASRTRRKAKTGSMVSAEEDRLLHLFTLSARSETALRQLAQRYQNYLENNSEIDLGNVCYTVNSRRSRFPHRLSILCDSIPQLRQQLTSFVQQQEGPGVSYGMSAQSVPPVAFLFTGQGSQFPRMGQELYQTQPLFRQIIDQGDRLLRPHLERPLLEVLYPKVTSSKAKRKAEKGDAGLNNLDETGFTQPTLFVLEYALAQLWMSWGIQPGVVIGHSVGEYVAACVAGVFSFEDGVRLIAARGRLMQALPQNGAMVSVMAEEPDVRSHLIRANQSQVAIAAINSPQSTVISGEREAIAQLVAQFTENGIKTFPLTVSHAFHSPLMEPMLAEFAEIAASVTYHPPQIPIISNVTGNLIDHAIATPDYWCQHILQPVKFMLGMDTLRSQGFRVFLEIGAKPVLLGLGRTCLATEDALWLASLRPGQSDWQTLLTSLATLNNLGVAINWPEFDRPYTRQVLHLPTYPFQRQRYWWEGNTRNGSQASQDSQTTQVSRGNIAALKDDRPILHPLLHEPLQLAGTSELRFQTQISATHPVYLQDHCVAAQVVFPAAGFLEIALAAGAKAGFNNPSVHQFQIEQALILSSSDRSTLQIVLSSEDQGYRLQIFSLQKDEKNWIRHVIGVINENQVFSSLPNLTQVKDSFLSHPISATTYYQQLRQQSLNYGVCFQAIERVWREKGQSLSQIQIPEKCLVKQDCYYLHPVVLDACFQTVAAACPSEQITTYLPAGMEALRRYADPDRTIWCWVKVQQPEMTAIASSRPLKADLCLFNPDGTVVAELQGLLLQPLSQSTLKRRFGPEELPQDWVYKLSWQPCEGDRQSPSNTPHHWLVLYDESAMGTALAKALEQQGDRCSLLFVTQQESPVTTLVTTEKITLIDQINSLDSVALKHAVATAKAIAPITDVVYLGSRNQDASNKLQRIQIQPCASVLHLVQAFPQEAEATPRLWVVTQASQAIAPTDACPNVAQAALWGLARTIRLERPDLRCTCIDLENSEPNSSLQILVEELRQSNVEDQIAYRQGVRYVARLVPQQMPELDRLTIPEGESFRLGLTQYGVLDHLTLMPMQRQRPRKGEVEIQVRAAGVNFRDVLNALGMLQPYLEQMGFATAEQIPFGGECAGIITAVGEGVMELQVGDAVIAAQAIGSLAQYVIVDAHLVARKPDSISFAEAATIPTACLTAAYGLCHLAKLKRGDRVLIHSAAGGVGLAAVQLAQQIGAEIYATASAGKWNFLRSIGVQHIFDSRSLAFAEAIAQATGGKGVDVVLNSLNGDYIPRSLELLAPNGRFVEIGKIGIWATEQIHAQRPDVDYFAFDLLEVSRKDLNCIANLFASLLKQFQLNVLQPIHHTVFEITAIASALRYMAQAKHIGKVVISLPPIPYQQPIVRQDGSYLITGGLGALGLQTAQWLAQQGATQLILVGRNTPSGVAQRTLDELAAEGIKVIVAQADITQVDQVASLLKLAPLPLRGVIHAAGVLDDGILQNLTWDRFQWVMSPKVEGAWNLHELTRSLPLDFFICFSSVASLIGSAGQGSYAAANAALDGLIHYRRRMGLPGLSINWGAWATGMAAQLTEREQRRLTAQGMRLITPDSGLSLMAQLLRKNSIQAGVLPFDWSIFLSQGNRGQSPLFERLNVEPQLDEQALSASTESVPMTTGDTQSAFLQTLTQNGDRTHLLQEHLREQLAKVLGFNTPDYIDVQENFADLGMDSLMAVEFSNRLQSSIGYSFPQSLLFDYPSVALLAHYLIEDLRLKGFLPEQTNLAIADTGLVERSYMKRNDQSVVVVDSFDEEQYLYDPSENQSSSSNFENPDPDTSNLNTELASIPEHHYQFHRMPEYVSLKQDLERLEIQGNPFFVTHEGIARDTVQIHGQTLISYASYNYLGMSGDPVVSAAAAAAIQQYGTSVSASRVVSGERPIHRELEQGIAQFLGTEDCIVYIGGHPTNVTTIGHLFGERDLILYDALSHNSIRQGCNLSGATLREFPHNDWQTLERLLIQNRTKYEKVLITVEGVYSTDGDLAVLPQIVALKKHFKTFLLVDEAHSIGVLGQRGKGIGEHFGIAASEVDLWMGTLSKSFASCGGYIAGCKSLVEYLKYTAPGFVFSVGMTPANAAAALASLRRLQVEPERVGKLQERSRLFLKLAQEQGLNTGTSANSPIVPIIVGEPQKAIQLCHQLFKQGIHVQPMIHPSVPYNAARLRFFLSCLHSEEQIRFTVSQLVKQLRG